MHKIPLIQKENRKESQLVLFSGYLIIGIFFLFWFLPEHIPSNFHGILHAFDYIFFILLSYIVWLQIIKEAFNWHLLTKMKIPIEMKPEIGKKVAFLTAFVPGCESIETLRQTLRAMKDCEYPHDTWVLDEGDDIETKKMCEDLGVKHFTRKGITKYNSCQGKFKARTKGGNYNAWFDKHGNEYDYVAQLDVDFVPSKYFLMSTLGYFEDPEVAFVGTPQIYGNQAESWIARGASEQAFPFYGNTQRGLFGDDMLLFIGANHIVRVKAFNDIGGYAGHIVEDHLTGMKFYAKHWKSVYVSEVLAIGEGPATWSAYFNQQMRWAYGLFDILFRHTPKLIGRMKWKHAVNYLFLQQHYFDGLSQVISIFLMALYFLFGFKVTEMPLWDLLLLYIPVLLAQQLIFLFFQQYYIDKKTEKGFHFRGRFLGVAVWPIYFLALICVIRGKKLNYKVTPKGIKRENVNINLFFPHFLLGSLTLFPMIIGIYFGHAAWHLIILSMINTVLMYFFVGLEVTRMIRIFVKNIYLSLNSVFRSKRYEFSE